LLRVGEEKEYIRDPVGARAFDMSKLVEVVDKFLGDLFDCKAI
jgi:hypothetical protein